MKKNKIRLTVLLSFFSIIVLYENKLLAQEKEQEILVSTMRTMRNNIRKTFSDNKHALIANKTENMLTDDQCWEWVGKGSVLQKRFTGIEECAGDSLYNIFYEDGLIVQQGLGDQLFFVGEFNTKNNVLNNGMTKTQIKKLLGMPYKESNLIMVYKKELHPEIAFLEGSKFDESVILFFENNKLIAIWVKFYMLC